MPLTVVVTGAGGMVGRALVEALAANTRFRAHAFDRPALDVGDSGAVAHAVSRRAPDAVVNCAAWTDVDACEADPIAATRVNAAGVRHVASAAEAAGAALVQLSTDYVFDGEADTPYTESSPTGPVNVYGRTKLWGEREAARCARHFILRTSWVYAERGSNFVRRILAAARSAPTLRVVEDQVGASTYARDLAGAVVALLSAPLLSDAGARGVYHVTNAGACSRREQAERVLQLAGLRAEIEAARTAEDGRAARRPRYTVLSNRKWEAAGLPPLRRWEEALADCVARLRDAGETAPKASAVAVRLDERRRSVRHTVLLPVRAEIEGVAVGVREMQVSTKDVSLTGIGLLSGRAFTVSQDVRLTMELAPGTLLRDLRAVVRWCRRAADGSGSFLVGVALGPMRRRESGQLTVFLRHHVLTAWLSS